MDPAPGFNRYLPHDMSPTAEQPRRSVPMIPTESQMTALAPAIGVAFVDETIV
jgi:hypothetical protein